MSTETHPEATGLAAILRSRYPKTMEYLAEEVADLALSWLTARLTDDDVVEVVAEAAETAAIAYLGRDLGTIHRDDIARAALSAAAAVIGGGSDD